MKAAARELQKEARRILKRKLAKLSPDAAEEIRAAVAAIDNHRANDSLVDLEREAERIDELLHEHASFARKSAIREIAENVGIALAVAMIVRSVLYEPFKIPSGSMMPTLQIGDHIFVDKYSYGVQLPFTNYIVGEDWLEPIRRGDVVVFRYPLNEEDDYIKRVIGLPGDTIRVDGEKVSIKRRGEPAFEVLPRKRLDEKCREEGAPNQAVSGCVIYEETLDDRSYRVRYLQTVKSRFDYRPLQIHVPEGKLLMMGDNRRMSHDSLAWMTRAEAVAAEGLLSLKDLKDLTEQQSFTPRHPQETQEKLDFGKDSVLYLAERRSPAHSLELELWRDPDFDPDAIFEALSRSLNAEREVTIEGLLGDKGKGKLHGAARDRVLEVGGGVDQIRLTSDAIAHEAVILLKPAKTVFRYRCGIGVCKDDVEIARRISELVSQYHSDHDQDARELIEGDPKVRYLQHWRARDDDDDRYVDLLFRDPSQAPEARHSLRLRAWRHPDEGLELLRDINLMSFGSDRDRAKPHAEFGEDAWMVETDEAFRFVIADHKRDFLVVLECGKERFKSLQKALGLATTVTQQRVPNASKDGSQLRTLLGLKDAEGWTEFPRKRSTHSPWDRVTLDGSVRGEDHTVQLDVSRKPESGLEATVARWRNQQQHSEADDSIRSGGWSSASQAGYDLIFTVPETEVALRFRCGPGVCSDRDTARALARRIAEKAEDTANYVDPDAERPAPFVPRENVKGRARRIWAPMERFWTDIQ